MATNKANSAGVGDVGLAATSETPSVPETQPPNATKTFGATDDGSLSGSASRPSPQSLQEILPEINRLALKVGGLKRLSEIIATLPEAGK